MKSDALPFHTRCDLLRFPPLQGRREYKMVTKRFSVVVLLLCGRIVQPALSRTGIPARVSLGRVDRYVR